MTGAERVRARVQGQPSASPIRDCTAVMVGYPLSGILVGSAYHTSSENLPSIDRVIRRHRFS